MLTEVNIAARFLPNREFHRRHRSASAPRTASCRRMGCGHLSQVFCCILVAIMLGTTLAAPWALTFHPPSAATTVLALAFARARPTLHCSRFLAT
jgi:hypothetical protein